MGKQENKMKMKAVRLVEIGKALAAAEISVPEASEREVLIKVKAAGICHTDEHYRAGDIKVPRLPITPGHEVAGIVEKVGNGVSSFQPGDRVCLHYLATCGVCHYCLSGNEQFCAAGQMIGKDRDGGYAEYIVMPAASLVALPEEISFEHGAVMMCSTATAFHALVKARLKTGERVAVFGCGGLGFSAIQLALLQGAREVFAVDIRKEKLQLAAHYGAIPVNAATNDAMAMIREITRGRGVDVALEMAGLALTAGQALRSLGKLGRMVLVGLCDQPFVVRAYSDMLGNEAEIIGCSDHLHSELPIVLEFARQGRIDLSRVVARQIPLLAAEINETLRSLQQHNGEVRTVIVP
jgi:propanol-preferring alcohol dehydrogenase